MSLTKILVLEPIVLVSDTCVIVRESAAVDVTSSTVLAVSLSCTHFGEARVPAVPVRNVPVPVSTAKAVAPSVRSFVLPPPDIVVYGAVISVGAIGVF
jgi:hypothetical protein